MSCKHWSATDKDCRDVHTGCCHQKTRHVLVTVRNHNQSVKLMCHCQGFCRICDQISCYKRILHTNMSHGDSVTNCDCRNHDRYSSCHCHSHLDCLCDLIQVHMPRNDLIIRTYDSDQWLLKLLLRQSQCIEKGTVRCLLNAFFYCITSHFLILSLYIEITIYHLI